MTSIASVVKKFKLPPQLKFYSIAGKKIFDVRNSDGSLHPSYMLYLITKEGKVTKKFGVEFSTEIKPKELKTLLTKSVKEFQANL